MTRHVFRSLDRTFVVFGLRGKWLIYGLGMIVGGIVLGFIIGGIIGGFVKMMTVLLFAVGGFIGSLVLQKQYPEREISKIGSRGRIPKYLIRRESLTALLRTDELSIYKKQ